MIPLPPPMPLSDPCAGYDERVIMRAWEGLVTSGHMRPEAAGGLRALIQESWARCASTAIAPECREAPLAAAADHVEQLRHASRELRSAAQDSFARVGRLLEGTAVMLILTDQDGVIVEAIGDHKTLEQGRRIHLEVGGVWSEGVVGTNGIGTALWTGEPVFVHAAEHFCAGIKPWSCAGMPIRDPFDGRVIGVVDLSGLIDIFRPHNTALVALAARDIEGVLARRQCEERTRLLETFLGARLGTGRQEGLILLDRQGRVIYSREMPRRVSIDGVERELAPDLRLLPLREGLSEAELIAALPPGLCPDDVKPLRLDGAASGMALLFPRGSTAPAARGPAGAGGARAAQADPHLIVGRSEALLQAVELARRVARSGASVLVEGETGVGKELFARLLHREAGRAGGSPYVPVNCGAIAKELFGSELFGHVAGAFTGAAREGRPGRFEQADGGTLCLDEIGEMPADVQPYLLRVLEDRIVYRIGDARGREVDVQLVALTNRSLKQEVDAGRFRRDLYYRISTVTVQVPPLRERGQDIELLARHFDAQLAARDHEPPLRLTDAVLATLLAYRWPGNVRELKSLIVRLRLLVSGREVRLADLPPEIAEETAPPARAIGGLDQATRQAIAQAIAAEGGNMTRVAQTLGISRPTLYRKLKLYGLDR